MVEAAVLYAVTASVLALGLPVLWYFRALSAGKLVFLLFIIDIALTIEAAFYSDIVLIALLHVVTIPAFFGLIYFDLIQQHKTKFRCFICGKSVEESQPFESVNRFVGGEKKKLMSTHRAFSLISDKEKSSRKTPSEKEFQSNQDWDSVFGFSV